MAMWCASCQQDVSATADVGGPEGIRCARCLATSLGGEAAEVAGNAGTHAPPLPPDFDDWELDYDLRSAERLADSLRSEFAIAASTAANAASLATWPGQPAALAAARLPARNADSHPRGGFLTWSILSLGVTTFVCGSVLLAWSFLGDRPDLRTPGLPLTLAGQAALIIGLVLQLEGLWHSNRQTRHSLDDLDGRLDELRHATTLVTSSHSAAGQSFYAHMAEGASPELLLADLKGQMDLLAQRMAAQRRAA